MSGCPVEVVKVGGSLLARSDLSAALGDWLRRQTDRHVVLVVGGGELVNQLRAVDRQVPLNRSQAHWLAIEVMQFHALLLAWQLPEVVAVEGLGELRPRLGEPGVSMLLCRRFLIEEEPVLPGVSLPEGWQVTSDSIAARVAISLGSPLRLLKSRAATPDETGDWSRAALTGLVDEFFPHLASEVKEVTVSTLPHFSRLDHDRVY